jgi:D-alanyl-D-alanine carboxypeptidase
MTRKARALGMRNTVYVNANGLPDDQQITTARDEALLGMAIQERFPKYYRYFSLASFVYQGHLVRNHNHLLGKVEGLDGIKTGYTYDSGFNLITSVKRGARHIVAVVLGGRSAGSRDARMRELIAAYIDDASTRPAAVAQVPLPTPAPAAAADPKLATIGPPVLLHPPSSPPVDKTTTAIANANAPITPNKVKTVTVKLVPPKNSPAVKTAAAQNSVPATTDSNETSAPAPRAGVLGKLPAVMKAVKQAAITPANAAEALPTRHTTRGGWAIQIGAYEDAAEAKEKLSSAKDKVLGMVERAEGYIERTIKGAKTYYRARFAGFDRRQAEAACKHLKKNDIACMAMKI